ncbi:MAG TPA: rod shape-determining protein MreC, partial [Steroidobacteraceae bacterium]|nr:rod shape-determining protein MreC [Steroidobacteraceae bacterium]
MVAFGGAGRPVHSRVAATGLAFTFYATLSIVLMFLDQRGNWLEYARYGLSAAAYPVQLAVDSPSAAWHWVQESFATREALQARNDALRAANRALAVRTLRIEALEAENAQLRALKAALPDVAEKWLPGEIMNIELSTLRQRVTVNKGATSGVFKGQAVLARGGLMGQVLRAGPWSSEIILITDPEHAVPVQVLRSGLRTIAVGQGNAGVMTLPYLPVNSDIKVDDLLVTSGLGGVFPAGYPVARVIEVGRDPGQPLALVRAQPLAAIDRDREVTFVWFKPGHPAAPAPLAATAPQRDFAGAAQSAPPKPKPAPPAATPATPPV